MLRKGARVQVQNRFDRRWIGGFVVDQVKAAEDGGDARYRVKRVSDGSVVPDAFGPGELRSEGPTA